MAGLSAPYRIKAATFCYEVPASIPRGVFPNALPRRMSKLSKICLHCVSLLVQEQGESILQLPLVYASRHGELDRTHALFEEWRDYGEMSPAGFSLSVHNATASLLGLACHNQNNSTTLAAGPDSLAMGILEAAMICRSGTDCLLLYGDCYPEPTAAALIVEQGESLPLPETLAELKAQWTKNCHP